MKIEQEQKWDSSKTEPETANQQAETGWNKDYQYQDIPKPIGEDDQVY